MDGIYQAWQTGLLWVCLCALGAMAAWLYLAKVAAPAWDAVRRWWSLPCIQRVLVGVCVVGLSYYGATKQGWHVGYDGGIKAGATANVVTNDTVSIHWQRDTSGGVYVPETATVYIDYRPNTATNEEWGLLAQTTVGAWGWSGTVANATNYDYNVWAYYIPPEPVHTNGVWTYKTHFDRNGEYALPLRARVEVNGVAIATPAEKRKDAERVTAKSYIQDGLVAMWDGIENAGWGVHSANATVWKDLVGTNDAPLTISANLYFERDSLVGKNGKYAGYEGAYPIELSGDVTYEACWSRDTKFSESADSSAKFGFLALDVFSGKAFVKAGKKNRADYSVGVTQGQRFTLSLVGAYDTSAANLVAYCNGTRLTGGVIASGNYATPQLRFGSGWQNPSSHHFNIRLYSRALSADEIRHNHNIDKRRFNLP